MKDVLRSAVVLAAIVCAVMAAQVQRSGKVTESNRRLGPDGKTTGWFLEVPWPDQDDPSQAWRKIATTLVVAEDGRVVRRIERNSFVNWNFWHGGREVVFGSGGALWGALCWERVNVRSGRVLARWTGDAEDKHAPSWVQAADGN